jgi:putative transposase
MARANRHYLPGYIWHITHRCHKKEFLLKFSKDCRHWLQWLFVARRRYELLILDYMVTSNHIHLLLYDGGSRDVIPRSIQLVAGRTGQSYNQRKHRKGAFWEDRYHATAVDTQDHLRQCLVYIDLNMVRAGVVEHPSEWPFCGYNEIQQPRRKCRLIAYEQLQNLLGFSTYGELREAHRSWVEEAMGSGRGKRESKWSESVAVGNHGFVEGVRAELGVRSKGRKVETGVNGFELREPDADYVRHSDPQNEDIGSENACLWETCRLLSGR